MPDRTGLPERDSEGDSVLRRENVEYGPYHGYKAPDYTYNPGQRYDLFDEWRRHQEGSSEDLEVLKRLVREKLGSPWGGSARSFRAEMEVLYSAFHWKYSYRHLEEARQELERALYFDSTLEGSPGTMSGFNRNNIVGIGIGDKMVQGERTGEDCIMVFVIQKVPERLVIESLVPREVNGIPTDVVESGELHFSSGFGGQGRACGGISIGSQHGDYGTLGCILEAAGKEYILAAGHVIAGDPQSAVGDSILHPSIADGGVIGRDNVARLMASIVPDPAVPKPVDCAIAELLPGIVTLDNQCFGPISTTPVTLAYIHVLRSQRLAVGKCGRTSQFTTGEILAYPTVARIRLLNGQRARLQDQMIIMPTSGSAFGGIGDSGALVLTMNGLAPVGLYCGEGQNLSVASPMETVLSELKALTSLTFTVIK